MVSILTKRKHTNWLHGWARHVQDTESPRDFWVWAGIFILSSVLQRKVWFPWGVHGLFPNLYLMLVAPPGKARKGPPVSLSKEFLKKIKFVNLFADSPTVRTLTQYMDQLCRECRFKLPGQNKWVHHCSISLISDELGSFFKPDQDRMINFLTDVWDSKAEFEYRTATAGVDFLKNSCVNCFFATTPEWVAEYMPRSALGGGLTSRFITIYADQPFQRLYRLPPLAIKPSLISDLKLIGNFVGEFKITKEADQAWQNWYEKGIDKFYERVYDQRLHPFISRLHTHVLKVAMCLNVAHSSKLEITEKDYTQALELCVRTIEPASKAFGSQGGSTINHLILKTRTEIEICREISFQDLLRHNAGQVSLDEMHVILTNLEAMGYIRTFQDKDGLMVKWINQKRKSKGKDSP